jgi:hypothetical protein
MNKTSAQKIRRLEMRIAHLEREAGLWQQIKNIPQTFMRKIDAVGSEISSYFKISPRKAREARESVIEALRVSLDQRIRAAQDVNLLLDDTAFVSVLEFNIEAPELSLVQYKGFEMSLKDLTTHLRRNYEDTLAKDVKGAYVSFYRDYKNIILSMQSDEPSKAQVDSFFLRVKRASKLAYRVLKSLYELGAISKVIYDFVSYEKVSKLLENLGMSNSPVWGYALGVFSNFSIIRIVKSVLNIAEATLRRRDSNIMEFDRLVGGRTASSYNHTARFARQLEQYC